MNDGYNPMDTRGINKSGAINNNESETKRDKQEVIICADNTPNNAAGSMNPNDDARNADVAEQIQQRAHEAVNVKGGFKSNIKMEWVME